MPSPNEGNAIRITTEDLAGIVIPEAAISAPSAPSSGAKVYGTINETAEQFVTVPTERASILLQGWFYLGLAGMLGALAGWAIAEPGFADGISTPSQALTADWDTLGWIFFKMGDLERAENYVAPAWHLRQEGLVGDHLGQIYERQKKLSAALHMYNLALEANPRMEETPSRMRNLAHVPLPEKRMDAREELTSMPTIILPTITKTDSTADFDVLLVAGKIQNTKFLHGSDVLRDAGKNLESALFKEKFPLTSTARLARRGILSCSSYTGCNFVFYPLSVAASTN